VVPRSPQRRDRRADRTAQRTAQHPDERAADRPAPAPRQRRRDTSRIPTSLTVVEGPLRGTSLPLRDAGVLIGRNPECALVLDDDYASGRHARIYRGDDGWYVEDLGSTNGTYLGSHRLTAAQRVEAGSVLRIGKTAVELRK
jgi:pSer/pThr/pTyr-binding forkhead associated (FHA) protein